jgi:hypothetical protein
MILDRWFIMFIMFIYPGNLLGIWSILPGSSPRQESEPGWALICCALCVGSTWESRFWMVYLLVICYIAMEHQDFLFMSKSSINGLFSVAIYVKLPEGIMYQWLGRFQRTFLNMLQTGSLTTNQIDKGRSAQIRWDVLRYMRYSLIRVYNG